MSGIEREACIEVIYGLTKEEVQAYDPEEAAEAWHANKATWGAGRRGGP